MQCTCRGLAQCSFKGINFPSVPQFLTSSILSEILTQSKAELNTIVHRTGTEREQFYVYPMQIKITAIILLLVPLKKISLLSYYRFILLRMKV